jgi:integrase
MSVQRYETADGSRWRVRWREPNGHMRSRTLMSRTAATAFDADVRARKYKGEALPRATRETLAEAHEQWWKLRGYKLASNTQRTYNAVWKAHVENRHDHYPIAQLASEPQLLEEMLAEMAARGVGNAAQRKVIVVISSVLTACVKWGKIATNPAWQVEKPPAAPQRIPHPFPPVVIERIRLRMLRRAVRPRSSVRNVGDATLVSLISYAGLRPGEALALTFGDIGARTLAVDKAVSDGEIGPTKTRMARTVPLIDALRDDLDHLRKVRGDPPDHHLVLPATDRGLWTRSEFNNWRNRVWRPVPVDLAAAHDLRRLKTARPYDCRGSFVSLVLRAGHSPLEVARWAGHSPAIMFRHYANVIEDLVGEPAMSATEQIQRAREAVREKQTEELDELVVDLLERPTLAAAEGSGAAEVFYRPQD